MKCLRLLKTYSPFPEQTSVGGGKEYKLGLIFIGFIFLIQRDLLYNNCRDKQWLCAFLKFFYQI